VAEPNAPVSGNPGSQVLSDIWDDLAFDPIETISVSSVPNPIQAEVRPSNEMSPGTTPRNTIGTLGPFPIEDQIISLPSNGNTSIVYRDLEVTHRIRLAEEQLNHIRNLIAEKSFQFSHVIRVSPRKGVTTRSRAAVKKLNNQIAEHGRMYGRCRAAIQILKADDIILSRLKILTPMDVGGSTAMLNPNAPGSSRIKLSWIWQTSGRHLEELPLSHTQHADSSDPHVPMAERAPEGFESLSECMFLSPSSILRFSFFFSSSACPLAACPGSAYEMARRGHINHV
jgi:hypothetical protein